MKLIPSKYLSLRIGCMLAGAMLLMSGCKKHHEFEYIDDADESSYVTINVSDENGNNITFQQGSTIGVYVIGEDGNVTLINAEVDENGNAVLPSSAQGNTVIAYTPVQDNWGSNVFDTHPIFTVQKDQSNRDLYVASDLMIGTLQTSRATGGDMTLPHMLAKVAINIVDETGQLDLSQVKTELLNVNTSVSVDFAHQKVSTIPDDSGDIRMLPETSSDWIYSSYAIVAPQSVSEDTTFFAITLYNSRQVYTAPEASTLEGGKTYTINMRLTDYGIIYDKWYITDWEDEGEHQLDIII